jgi:uncharacterized repeat protein (TIGR01451 family)
MFSVTAAAGCSWNATTSASFITLNGNGFISGSRQVAYSVAPNMSTSSRSGTIVIAGQTFSVSQSGSDMLNCSVSTANPIIVRAEALAELSGQPYFACTLLPPGGTKADIQAFFNTNVTSRLLNSNSLEALLLINEPANPVLGTNAFPGVLGSSNSVLFSQVQLPPTNSPLQLSLRIVNVRLNASPLGLSGVFIPTQVLGYLTLNTGSGPTVVNNSFQVEAYIQPGVRTTQGAQTPGPNPSTQLGFLLNFKPGYADAFHPLFGTCNNGPQCPAPGQDPSLLGLSYYSESGYLNSSVFGPVVGFADTGTRMLARFTNIPAGLRLFAPIIPATSSVLLTAQLVGADNNGAGGTFISPANQEAYREITVVNGVASVTWETKTSDPFSVDTLKPFVYFQGVSQPRSQAQLNQIAVKLNLAPLSTVNTPSPTAPLPRFLDLDTTVTLPPCPTCVPLTLGTNPPGLQIMADGLVAPQNVAQPVVPGLTHTLSVDPNPHTISGQQYRFTGWSNGVTTPSQSLVVSIAATITANFAATGLSVFMTHSGPVAPSQSVVYTVTVNNSAGGTATNAPVTVTEIPPAGLTLTGMSGSGWNCSANTCMRSDALNPGSSYPVITVNMNVLLNATSPQVNLVSVSGGGSATVNFSDPAIVGPALSLSRDVLNFGTNFAHPSSVSTGPQQVAVNFSNGGALNWTASSNQSNITVLPSSGTGNGVFQVSGAPGPAGFVTVTAPSARNSPLMVQVNINNSATTAPFGSFDTPANNTIGVVGAIPVTGWALDNFEVTGVDIWREAVTGEPAGNLIFVGNDRVRRRRAARRAGPVPHISIQLSRRLGLSDAHELPSEFHWLRRAWKRHLQDSRHCA